MLTSRKFERPRLPNMWTSTDLIRGVMEAHGTLISHGFASKVPGGLPASMLSTIAYLDALDQVLERSRGLILSDKMQDTVRSAISDVQHRVMTWPELHLGEGDSISPALYECCRWTVMLYSMAVIFPIPVASGWHVRLLQHLHVVLEDAQFEVEDAHALLLWSLFTANIAAVRTSEQPYFEQKLRGLLITMKYVSWTVVHDQLVQFLWADSACNEGGLAVWNAVWTHDAALERPAKLLDEQLGSRA